MSTDLVNKFLLSTVEERLHIIQDQSKSEQLRIYFGDNAYAEYVALASRTLSKINDNHLGGRTPKNLIFIPGVMGSYLKSETIGSIWWIDIRNCNHINDLKLAANGQEDANPDYQLIPCSIDCSYEGFTSAVLRQDDFGLVSFPYDWRKPITFSTSILKNKILELYASNGNKPVHLVAHSMGGLLVRATLMNYGQELWSKVGQIVFIGTPHYGSPRIASYLKNHLWGFNLMALLGTLLSRDSYRSLWGVLSLLPAPLGIYPGTRQDDEEKWASDAPNDPYVHPCNNFDLYKANNWNLSLDALQTSQLQEVLDGAFNFHQQIYHSHIALDQKFRDRIAVIAGVGHDTLFRLAYHKQFFGVWERMTLMTQRDPGNLHREGDNSVPLASASLEYVGEIRYVKGKHGELPNIPTVYEDVLRWLRGDDMKLPKTLRGALSSHLASGTGVSETPHLDSIVESDFADDPGLWNLEELEPEQLVKLMAKLEAAELPEFSRVRLL
jgi:pimeloyl-ACP methyl ester carboxylesterase